MKTKYEKLDALILLKIGDQSNTFNDLFGGEVMDECSCIAHEENMGRTIYTQVDTFRILERRLQALRKAGKIHFLGSGKNAGWALVDKRRGA